MSARMATRSFASRFDSGSSIRKAFGSRTIARPMATRWRWPPESWAGLRSSRSVSSSISAASCTRRARSDFETFAIFSGKAMLSATFR